MQHTNIRGNEYARLHDSDAFRVSPEDPDPTGWTVVDEAGERVGTVDELLVDTDAMKVRYVEIELDGGNRDADDDGHVFAAVDQIDLLEDQKQAVVRGVARDEVRGRFTDRPVVGPRQRRTETAHDRTPRVGEEEPRLTRAEEEIRVGTREVPAGEVVIGKHVESEHVSIPVERRIEHVRLERRSVSGGDIAGQVRLADDEVRIPVVEDEVVVEKRPVVREEIVVHKDVETRPDSVEADVRKERVDVKGRDELVDETSTSSADRDSSNRKDGGHRG